MSAHDEDEEVKAFSCRVENVKTITDILNCLCIDVNKAQPCDVEATPDSKYKDTYIASYPSMLISFDIILNFSALFFIVTGKGKATQVLLLLFSSRCAPYNHNIFTWLRRPELDSKANYLRNISASPRA